MNIEIENKFSDLNRRVKLTSKARYNASRRLKLQNNLSQWTLALLSVALILISLISASEITTQFNKSYIDIMQIIFAVLILTYSLLLSTGDYSARCVKIHRCGMELGRIARKIKPYEGVDDKDSEYEKFTDDYYNCLEKYENHESVDYLVAYYSSQDSCSKQLQGISGLDFCTKLVSVLKNRFKMKVAIWWGNAYPVSHYFISVFGVYYWLYYMICG